MITDKSQPKKVACPCDNLENLGGYSKSLPELKNESSFPKSLKGLKSAAEFQSFSQN